VAQILDGKAVAKAVRARIKSEVQELALSAGRPPGSVFIQVGENPASTTYVSTKHRMAEQVGISSRIERLAADASQEELLAAVRGCNEDRSVHSILVQLPLPEHIDEHAVALAISPRKDVDCFHPENVGRLMIGLPGPKPATPQGVLMLLDAYGINVYGMDATVVGRSNLVGKPLGLMLLARHATVTYCHTRTRDLGGACRRADLLIAAGGRPGLITAGMVKPGAVVVDVGTNYVPAAEAEGAAASDEAAPGGEAELKLVGDVDFAAVEPIAGYISPVPGGVGPMTIASVLQNVLTLYRLIEGME